MGWPDVLPSIGALALGYLLGSIPFGLVLTRLAGMDDIRSTGSGNIGATNVLRTGHKGLAAATLIGDALKGTVAVLAAKWFGGPDAAALGGVGAFLGHLFPIWLGFKGGKGVATYIGILLGLAWPAVLVFAVVWIAIAAVTRYSSLAGLIASAAAPVYLAIIGERTLAIPIVLVCVLLWIKHAANIQRLCNGTESKIGAKTKPETA